MGQSREELNDILQRILGSTQVYFQPPPTVRMQYPCIVYERIYAETKFANDRPYLYHKRYQVTVIDRDPDSEIPDRVAHLPMTSFNRHFTADQLHHDVFNVFF